MPRTDTVLADPRLAAAIERLGRARVKEAVAGAQQQARSGQISPDAVADVAVAGLPGAATSLLPVLNATGVLLHTNLGRAPLSAAAVAAMAAAAGYTDLEFDLEAGTRGRRGRGALAALAAAVPAAEAVHVVNNNAAALVLAATALAAGREIVVSRGEMIEIGDGFRLPELMESTGARIREVGTTNRTALADYARACGPDTGFVLKVHPSNFRIEGFTAQVGVAELATLGVPVLADIGSGLLGRHPLLPDEPDAGSWLQAGAALVTASGDKLLGGPQAGLIFGQAALVRQLARHPLARALRVDKTTAAALEATLTGPPVPLVRALAEDEPSLARRARQLARPAGRGRAGCPAGRQHGRGRRRGCPRCAAAQRRGQPAGRAGRRAAGWPAGAQRAVPGRGRPDRGRPAAARPARGAAGPGRRAGRRGAGRRGPGPMQVIATAGHVDHGKSTLVRALTGMEPDRWAEERRRGLTIDLGFCWLTLPSGRRLAFVDVPGHERFVPNMLAGVGPVPAVLFTVAADEGWMPQSEEHLAAVHALGISHGLLVITRADLADPADAMRQAAERIAATSLGQVEAVAVSAVSGAGLPQLTGALDRLAGRLPSPDRDSPVRLWVDRAFSIKGSGTVVTGTLAAGTIRERQELLLTPALAAVRVRGIESLKERASAVTGVARVAVNLRGDSRVRPARGMALVQPDRWALATVADVRLAAAGQGAPRQLAVHIGAARTVARVRLLGGRIARLTLRDALPLHVGDRLLLRDPGAATGAGVAGATVLDLTPPGLGRRGAAAAAAAELAGWPPVPGAAELIRRHRLITASTLRAMGVTDLPAPVSGQWLADPAYWAELREQLAELVSAHLAAMPLSAGLPVEAARARLGLPARQLVEALAQPALVMRGGSLRPGRPPGHAAAGPAAGGGDRAARRAGPAAVRGAGGSPAT